MLRNRYSPANTDEALWLELEHLKRSAYPLHQPLSSSLHGENKAPGLHRESEGRGSRLYAIYEGHMKTVEESTLRAVMMVMSQSGQNVTLDRR